MVVVVRDSIKPPVRHSLQMFGWRFFIGVFLGENVDIRIQICNFEKYNGRKDVDNPSWFRFQNNFFDDNKMINLNNEEKLFFMWLLCEAAKNKNDLIFTGDTLYRQSHRHVHRLKESDLTVMLDKFVLLKLIVVRTLRGRYADVTSAAATYITLDNNTENILGVPPDEELESVFKIYPRRKGDQRKKLGLQRLRKFVKTAEDLELVKLSVGNYAKFCSSEKKTGTEFVKQFGTFFDSNGDWKEWAEKKQKSEFQEMTIEQIRKLGAGV